MNEVKPLQLAQARMLLDASAEAMLVVGSGGRILYANAVAARLFAYEPEELVDLDVDQLVPEAARGRHRRQRASYLTSPYQRAMASSERIDALCKDGTVRQVEISLSPLELEGRMVVVAAVVDISERLQREAAIHAANELNQQIIASANEGIIVFDAQGRYKLWNPFMESLTGVAERDCIGKLPVEVFPFLDDAGIAESVRRALGGETVENPPFRWSVPASGRSGWAVSIQAPLRDRDGQVVGVVDVVRDITHEQHARDQLQLAATVYKAIGEAIVVSDADNRIIAVNPAYTSLTGYSEREAVGQSTTLLKSGRNSEAFYRDMWLALEQTGQWAGEIWNRHKNGEVRHEWLAITTVYDDDGEVVQRIGALSDITERKRTTQTIWQQANFDPLTGLPNRRMFNDRLAQEIRQARRNERPLSLLFIDLDLFKEVNDRLGHGKGDLLLQEAAKRLLRCVREADTVARLGGDEFTVILEERDDPAGSERVARSILAALADPFVLGDDAAGVSVSIGIARFPDDADEIDDLLARADRAMYAAKQAGGDRYRYFTPEPDLEPGE